MTHTFECSIASASRQLQINAYRMLWPNHCRECHGVGGHFDTYDPSPGGVALSPGTMIDFDPCHWCLEEARCPRCATRYGGQLADELIEDGLCIACGWDGQSNASFEPPPYECGCWYELEFADYGVVGELDEGQCQFWDVPW